MDRKHETRAALRLGLAIPAHPLALTAQRKLDERRQRALSRYYIAAGVGGLAGAAGSGGTVMDPGTEGDGDVMVGPTYADSPDLANKNVPRGKVYDFTMRSEDSAVYRGEDSTLLSQNQRAFERQVRVYVPSQYVDGTAAPFMVVQDGYVADITLPRMLHAVYVRSPHPHARILSVDTSVLPGLGTTVFAFTGEDLRDVPPLIDHVVLDDLLRTPQDVVARDKVRFVGDAVAIVLAEDRYVAEDAAGELAAAVEYEVLDPVPDLNLTLSRPFVLAGREEDAPAVSADAGLSARFNAEPNQALEAHHLLADLAVLWLDAPASDRRAVVAVAPPGWKATRGFLDALSAGLVQHRRRKGPL